MKQKTKSAILVSAFAAALAVAPVSANAHFRSFGFSQISRGRTFSHVVKGSVGRNCKKTTSSGTGGHHGLTAAQGYVTGAMFCSAIWLIAHGYYVGQTQHRELTYTEAYSDAAGCWLPIIGPFLVQQWMAQQAHQIHHRRRH
jgi:hypothetical protein